MGTFLLLLSLLVPGLLSFLFLPRTLRFLGDLVGCHLRRSSRTHRELLLARVATEQKSYEAEKKTGKAKDDEDWEEIEGAMVGSSVNGGKADHDWNGIAGFFHPFCNAGGGGERVLWAAIRATQKRWPEAVCVVYTGDRDVDKTAILKRVKDRFNIHLHPPTVHFLYLTTRHYVLSTTWPRFTLLGQSLGSMRLAYDAFSLLVPDIFIDTMGYAFSLALSSWFFPAVPTAAYVHYPTISTDMLDSLNAGGQGINAGAGEGYRGLVKKQYWHLFASLYSMVGSTIDVVMTNSSWTQSHIKSLWGPYRNRRNKTTDHDIDIVFPPVAVEELEEAVAVSEASEKKRGPYLIYIAQFRPEKNHQLILEAFASLLSSNPKFPTYPKETPKLVLIGSVRDSDDATRVDNLRLLAHELKVEDNVEFVCDATWPQMLDWMRKASIGVNGMWNEHFGIGVVEYQAAGLISVVNDSGGPKLDIVVEIDGKPTGFHASTVEQYEEGFCKALSLSPDETLAMRHRARQSASRFTDRGFAEKWVQNMDRLVRLQISRAKR
ncbi:UDP-Glycosyltransferase/glycogen phosphorylase [Lindgomyces ingoldianus]|uniref:UDP-Glycosyltransferase/glycogen phosphorylase n=1 Tax=Lindgomyces ingoldianus TaxID=673940 RepID=A0ACB6QKN0_9PLEO|nr:UDP-Glycosyltransferase/glycogen phosphorylase [Lindgomyces ingoldianus]KAF2467080.1 UDP-Glycosyltransferase/glycogen phosphorylase [Lindgomyces ingoldianus]